MAMMYHRALADLPEQPSAATLSHLAAIATDLGADLVKLDYAGSTAAMNGVVDSCPLPIVVAGGAYRDDDSAIALGTEVSDSRVAGLSFGRHVFGAQDPRRVASTLADHLHSVPVPRSLELA